MRGVEAKEAANTGAAQTRTRESQENEKRRTRLKKKKTEYSEAEMKTDQLSTCNQETEN